MRSNKGVTLVTLIITIIVLLILAAITIYMVVGQDGIMSKASNTKTNQMIATFRDAVQTGVGTLAENEQKADTTENNGTSVIDIKNTIQNNINNSMKDVDIAFECKDGSGNIIAETSENNAFPNGGTVKVTVTDKSGSTLKSVNISKIEVTINPTDWTIGTGIVTYEKSVDSKTNTIF